MTIEEMKKRKREFGYTYEQISKLSNVPLGTVQKIFAGVTESPRYDTIAALSQIFENDTASCVQEARSIYNVKRQGEYTLEDYYALPEEQRVELIDGVIYDMSAPTSVHQLLGTEILLVLKDYIRKEHSLLMYSLTVMIRRWYSRMSLWFVIGKRFRIVVFMVRRILS